ncbi:hypothetical protein [Glutamicibacter endophyticus]|uniref:hypothetical protein n=1 Tax=Glutamicibacter endophyticus TaxID=1522174 RepID=UPI003AF07562
MGFLDKAKHAISQTVESLKDTNRQDRDEGTGDSMPDHADSVQGYDPELDVSEEDQYDPEDDERG